MTEVIPILGLEFKQEEYEWPLSVPATIINVTDMCICINFDALEVPETETACQYDSFEEYIEGQLEFTKQLLKQISFVPGGEKMLWKCLLEHRGLKVASDGSWDRHLEFASFGWLLLGNGNVIVHGAGPVDGIVDAMSSTRAELVRFGSLIEFLYHFQKYNKIRES